MVIDYCHSVNQNEPMDTRMISAWNLPLINSMLTPFITLKSRSGVMMAVTLPSMLPIPNSRSMRKYRTDQSWGNGMFLMASLYTMKARPAPSTAWNRWKRETNRMSKLSVRSTVLIQHLYPAVRHFFHYTFRSRLSLCVKRVKRF